MAELRLFASLQFRDDALRQHLAEFYSPLVERIDLPDYTLRENAVLIKGDKITESLRRELFSENKV